MALLASLELHTSLQMNTNCGKPDCGKTSCKQKERKAGKDLSIASSHFLFLCLQLFVCGCSVCQNNLWEFSHRGMKGLLHALELLIQSGVKHLCLDWIYAFMTRNSSIESCGPDNTLQCLVWIITTSKISTWVCSISERHREHQHRRVKICCCGFPQRYNRPLEKQKCCCGEHDVFHSTLYCSYSAFRPWILGNILVSRSEHTLNVWIIGNLRLLTDWKLLPG